MPVDKEKIELLGELTKSVKKQILTNEIDIRYLERSKIKAKTDMLPSIENAIARAKEMVTELKKKLEVIEDDLNGK